MDFVRTGLEILLCAAIAGSFDEPTDAHWRDNPLCNAPGPVLAGTFQSTIGPPAIT
jgi:hypothetical protein